MKKYCKDCRLSDYKNTPTGIRLWCKKLKYYIAFWREQCCTGKWERND